MRQIERVLWGTLALSLCAAIGAGAQISGGNLFTIWQGGHSAIVSAGGAVKTDSSATTQPVSLATLPPFPAIVVASLPPIAITNSGFNVTNTPLIANTAFGVNNFPSGFAVNNFPSGFNVNGTPTINVTTWAGAALPGLGAQLASASIPVTIATNQATFPVNATIVNPLGQGLMSDSLAVAIASNQSTLNVACTSGCSGSTTFPYSSAATQTPSAASFLGAAGFDGTNVQPITTDTGGRLLVTLVDGTNTPMYFSANSDTVGGAAVATPGLPTASRGYVYDAFNAVWKRARTTNSITITSSPIGLPATGLCDTGGAALCSSIQPGSMLLTTTGGTTPTSAPSNATTVIKASAGRLARLLVTTVGAGTFVCFDNATTGSGTIIGSLGASAAVGTVEPLDMPALNGITCVSGATGPVVTVSWS